MKQSGWRNSRRPEGGVGNSMTLVYDIYIIPGWEYLSMISNTTLLSTLQSPP